MRKITIGLTLFLVLFFFGQSNTVCAAIGSWPNCSTPNSLWDPGGDKVTTIQGLECIVQSILHIVVRLAGLGAFIMIIIGGFQYLTSGGNPENTKKAQGTITWGIAGLAILLLSWLILLLIKYLTGVDVTQFVIPASPVSLPLLMK